MEKGSNRILAYKLAITIYNSNQQNMSNKIYFLSSETTKSLIHSATTTKSINDLNINL